MSNKALLSNPATSMEEVYQTQLLAAERRLAVAEALLREAEGKYSVGLHRRIRAFLAPVAERSCDEQESKS